MNKRGLCISESNMEDVLYKKRQGIVMIPITRQNKFILIASRENYSNCLNLFFPYGEIMDMENAEDAVKRIAKETNISINAMLNLGKFYPREDVFEEYTIIAADIDMIKNSDHAILEASIKSMRDLIESSIVTHSGTIAGFTRYLVYMKK